PRRRRQRLLQADRRASAPQGHPGPGLPPVLPPTVHPGQAAVLRGDRGQQAGRHPAGTGGGLRVIGLRGVSKKYDGGAGWAVRDVNLGVADGELLVRLGESGCGKTTTLKMINRLIEPTAGTIEVDGCDVMAGDPVALRRRIGYVFQNVGLFPHLTIAQNIAVTPQLLGWARDDVAARIDELLTLVNLPPQQYRDRLPSQLSGGQRQRVGLARALAA